MLNKEIIERFQKRLEHAVSENESWVDLNEYGNLMLDGHFSSSELKELASIMEQVESEAMKPPV